MDLIEASFFYGDYTDLLASMPPENVEAILVPDEILS
jgi:hypothetical protein